MCGIAGLLVLPGAVREADLGHATARMTDRIAHRGPDAGGQWLDPAAGVALGHRRLSILDLSPAGAQPMQSQCGRYVLAFNGEIYNCQDLRRELQSRRGPISWRGHSDTEVLLELIAERGVEEAVVACDGMLAIAVWDRLESRLTLARDAFGEKPLHYAWTPAGLAFASELKAFDAVPGFDRTIDPAALASYFKYGYIPAPLTVWEAAKKLPAATVLSLTHADLAARRASPRIYWSAASTARAAMSEPLILSQPDAEATTEELLTRSVTRRLASDVPLGALLSGGIDSSLVTALMQRASTQPVRTFSIGMDADGYDESESARAVARHLGTDHNELILSAADVQSAIPEIAGIYDEPFADSSQIPMFLVSRMARHGVTVALSGDGGDEIFGGYNRYVHAPRLWQKIERIPAPLRSTLAHILARAPDRAIAAVGPWLSSELAGGRAAEKVHKFARIMQAADRTAYHDQLLSTGGGGAKTSMGAAPALQLTDRADDMFGDFAMSAMLLDTTNYLPDDILVKVDRASMAVSLELRTPFLNREVFTHAWRLPPQMKTSSTQGKLILREILYRHVPRHLVDRPKSGFAIPLGAWLRGGLKAWADDLLSSSRLHQSDWLDPHTTRAVWQDHLSGRTDAAAYLWSVLMFQTWAETWLRDAAPNGY